MKTTKKCTTIKHLHTKYVNSKLNIDGRKEPIHKMNKPPCDVEGDRYREQDHTAKCQKVNNENGHHTEL